MNWQAWLIEPWLFFHKAMIGSLIVGVTCGLIGSFIILRRMALIGDALAHAVLPGVVVGFIVAGKNPLALFLGAVGAGLLTALLIGFVSRNTRVKEDTAIGVVFTGFFALGVMMISQLKRVHLDLTCYLFGQPLAVTALDLWLTGIIGAVVLLAIVLFYKQLVITSFDPVLATSLGISAGAVHYFLMTLLSMTVVASIQSVGVVLVVAMLITPGATAYLLTNRMQWMLVLAGLIGGVSALLGMYISCWLNLTSGEAMVVVCAGFFGLAMFFSPKMGIVSKAIRRVHARRRVALEDDLKEVFSLQLTDAPVTSAKLAARRGGGLARASQTLAGLRRVGWWSGDALTTAGKRKALDIIRAHRLWERFLVDRVGLSWDKLHAEAERIEHVLTPAMVEELDESLQRPPTDPHGAPIPTRDGDVHRPATRSLLELQPGERAQIVRVKDEDTAALRVLAEKGIQPRMPVEVVSRDNGEMVVRVGGQTHRLVRDVTEHILVTAAETPAGTAARPPR